MQEIYLFCLVFGAVVLIVQIVLGLFGWGGLGSDLGDGLHHDGAGAGFQMLSVRSVSAGAALLGAVGLWLGSLGVPVFVSAPAALVAGVGATVATAAITRQILRLESDGSLRLENAVGQAGTVYLPVPARRQGAGKVQFTLQGRTVELAAVANEPAVIPTGAAIIVVSVVNADTVEVVPTPQLEGIDA